MRKQRIEGKSHWPCASPDINELRLSRPKLLIAEQNEADTGSIAQPIQPKPPWRQDNICLAHYCFPIIEHSSWLLKQLVTQSTLFQWRANSGSLGQALFQKYYPVSGSCMCSWNSFSPPFLDYTCAISWLRAWILGRDLRERHSYKLLHNM